MPTHIERIAFTAALASACAVAVYLRRRRRKTLPPPGPPQPALLANAAELRRLLEVIEMEILPKTAVRVAAGDKVFGAAILKEDLGTVVAETNHETENPMYHGEVYAIREWSSVCRSCDPSVGPPAAADSIFLATHEPCCMCISSIVWSGFKRCYFLFPYETTRDQGIPHDLNIMYELWRVPRYRERNAFCATAGLLPLIGALEDGEARAELEATVARITKRYDELSNKYHSEKAANPLNTMAFN